MLSRVNLTFDTIRIRYPRLRRLVYRIKPNLFVRRLKLGKLLRGGDLRSGLTFARLSGDFLGPATLVTASPHVQFLRTYSEIGDAIFQPDRFAETAYCKYALRCIALYGRFFSYTDVDGILQRAKIFARMLDGACSPAYRHQSRPGAPVEVRRIKFSDCYEVIDGLHRLAVAAVRGLDSYPCAVLPTEGALTPMQLLVMDSVWMTGRCRLVQPISAPELQLWSVERLCTDRLQLIMAWLERNGISSGSFLDIGSKYGWFVSEMSKRGFQSFGSEQDAALATVGPHAYGLDESMITVANLVSFLRSARQQYDVVCCLSILHDYFLGDETTSAPEFIRSVDQVVGSVLFFDMGECHESHLKDSLRGWNAEYIRKWLLEHTTFSKIEILGTDDDNNGLFRNRYGRHLFACSRLR
jgi:2-polyprenyl-3-methyl-5-hydroxy-6-metoxy-1,4-benzoquinol methylase